MIFTAKEEAQAKYQNNIYTVATYIYMLKMYVLCYGHKQINSLSVQNGLLQVNLQSFKVFLWP